jgi:hypothetical protein
MSYRDVHLFALDASSSPTRLLPGGSRPNRNTGPVAA